MASTSENARGLPLWSPKPSSPLADEAQHFECWRRRTWQLHASICLWTISRPLLGRLGATACSVAVWPLDKRGNGFHHLGLRQRLESDPKRPWLVLLAPIDRGYRCAWLAYGGASSLIPGDGHASSTQYRRFSCAAAYQFLGDVELHAHCHCFRRLLGGTTDAYDDRHPERAIPHGRSHAGCCRPMQCFSHVLPSMQYRLSVSNEKLAGALKQIENLAHNDDLTGIANRRGLMERLQQCLHTAERNATPFCIALLDIDFFKKSMTVIVMMVEIRSFKPLDNFCHRRFAQPISQVVTAGKSSFWCYVTHN